MAFALRLPAPINRALALAGAMVLILLMFWFFVPGGYRAHNLTVVDTADFGKYIRIENLYTGRRTVGADVGLPVVWFRLRNISEQTVEEAKVRVYFLDSFGRTVHEADFLPVHSGFETDGSAKPLAPGEVWQMSFIRFYMPEGVPMTWQTGNARAEIIDLRLSED